MNDAPATTADDAREALDTLDTLGAPTRHPTEGRPEAARASSHLLVFSRSTVTSLFTTALDFLALVGLTELAGVSYVAATWAGTVVGSLSNFTINKHWAFDAKHSPMGAQFGRFLLVQLGSSALHTGGVWGFTRFGGLPYVASKTIVAALVYLAWNYPLNRAYVFRSRPSEAVASSST